MRTISALVWENWADILQGLSGARGERVRGGAKVGKGKEGGRLMAVSRFIYKQDNGGL